MTSKMLRCDVCGVYLLGTPVICPACGTVLDPVAHDKDGSFIVLICIGLFLLIVCACATWAPTREASLRREGAARLRNCIESSNCKTVAECYKESEEWCRSQRTTMKPNGLEPSCGEDALWSDPAKCTR